MPGYSDGTVIEQRGLLNARAAVDWGLSQVGGMELDSFVIAGSSAGSLATQSWSNTLLREFTYQNAVVIADSYAGVFPPGVQGKMLAEGWHICDSGLLVDDLIGYCSAETIELKEQFSATIQKYPDVLFTSINSKTDEAQMAFYNAIAMSLLRVHKLIEPSDFLNELGSLQNVYSVFGNYINYAVNSGQHEYLNKPYLSTTVVGSTKLIDWLSDLVNTKPGSSISSVCERKAGYGPFDCTCWDYCPSPASEAVFVRS